MKKYVVTVNGTSYEVMVEEVSNNEGVRPQVTQVVTEAPAPKAAPAPAPAQPKPAAEKPVASGSEGAKVLNCPMPGTIVKVVAKVGDSLKKGDPILVLEAMKMENDIVAPEDCVIASVNVQQGASVNSGDVLVTYN